MGEFRENTKQIMRRFLGVSLPGPIVDLCGRNHHADTAEIVKQSFETWDMQTGTDVNRVADAMRLEGVADASLGTVICTSAMEHVENPFLAAYQMARVTRPGGLLFVSVPFKFDFHQAPDDYWRYTVSALRLLFGKTYTELACDWFEPGGCYFYGRRGPEPDENKAASVSSNIRGTILEPEARFLFRMVSGAPEGGEIVELGTFMGCSCSALCHAAAKFGRIPCTIDDYSYKITTSPEIVARNLRQAGLGAHIIKADSSLARDEIKSISALFIDSLHTPEHFNKECDTWLGKVIKGGVVICHDYDHTKWKDLRPAIDARLGKWPKLGTEYAMVAFRKP